jgi:hypothetical protein
MFVNELMIHGVPKSIGFATAQTKRDHEALKLRKAALGNRYDLMRHVLMQYTGISLSGTKLRRLAAIIINAGIVHDKLDRLAVRCKSGLICWFCEHWEEVMNAMKKENPIQTQCTSNPPVKEPGVPWLGESWASDDYGLTDTADIDCYWTDQ